MWGTKKRGHDFLKTLKSSWGNKTNILEAVHERVGPSMKVFLAQ